MSSPNDNFLLKDGNDSPFKLRAKDVSAAQDGSVQVVRHLATLYPVDYGIGGCYHKQFRGGAMAAGLASNAPILALRNTSVLVNALIRKIKLNAWSTGTGFAAGLAKFELFVARGFTVQDTGGGAATMTSPQGKLRADMATSQCAIQVATTTNLTAGTRTLDADPVESLVLGAPTAANTQFWLPNSLRLFDKAGSDHPLLLVKDEGLVLQATVPATGTWSWSASIEWDEVMLVNF